MAANLKFDLVISCTSRALLNQINIAAKLISSQEAGNEKWEYRDPLESSSR